MKIFEKKGVIYGGIILLGYITFCAAVQFINFISVEFKSLILQNPYGTVGQLVGFLLMGLGLFYAWKFLILCLEIFNKKNK